MSKPIYQATPGQLVYEVGCPKRAGIVISNNNIPGKYFGLATVKWVDGITTTIKCQCLNDFQALIDDHKKKLNTHLATLTKLQALTIP